MDGVYRRQRYIYNFTRKYYLFGRDSLISELDLKPAESLVEVGCGTARNLILIARRHPGTRLFGLDASHEMLKSARAAIDRAGLAGRISLAHGYAEELAPSTFGEKAPFGHAIFPYSLSMIPQWKQALMRAAASSSKVHAVDFGDLTGLGNFGSRLMRSWLALFHVTPREEIVNALERAKPLFEKDKAALRLLPGRYAFLFHCGGETIAQVLAEDVAG